ncbi:MAG: hypothetical protein EOL98_14885 [Negativicutes bacterium]|nr:hypothetical protein [Negativicutes bacterium]
MPRRDGTGPMGRGSMTGRGLGVCTGVNASGFGRGMGMGLGLGLRGCRRGFGFGGVTVNNVAGNSDKEYLAEQKDLLEKRLELISKQLEEK